MMRLTSLLIALILGFTSFPALADPELDPSASAAGPETGIHEPPAERGRVPEKITPSEEKNSDLEKFMEVLKGFRFGAYMQFWWRIYEQAENGRLQMTSKDQADQAASGFSFPYLRTFIGYEHEWFDAKLGLRLEGVVGLTDAYVRGHLWKEYLHLQVGQFKIPSTYEVAEKPRDLDFPERSMFSNRVAGWALAKHANITSPFQGITPLYRDMGIALRGNVYGLRYFLMVGNGLGANLGIGASANEQYVHTNDFGAYYYGGRMSFDAAEAFPVISEKGYLRKLAVGAFVSYNKHDNLLFNDKRTVLDLERFAWAVDMQIAVTDYLRLTGMFGRGYIDDDFDFDGKRDYAYQGWEAKVVVAAIPETLEFAFRTDAYRHEYAENGQAESYISYSIGGSYRLLDHFKFSLLYRIRTEDSPLTLQDVDDDLILLAIHAWF